MVVAQRVRLKWCATMPNADTNLPTVAQNPVTRLSRYTTNVYTKQRLSKLIQKSSDKRTRAEVLDIFVLMINLSNLSGVVCG